MSFNKCLNRLVNNSATRISSNKTPEVNHSEIGGEFGFNNCSDIHIGPRYETSNNITINTITENNKENQVALKEIQSVTSNYKIQGSIQNQLLCKWIIYVVCFITIPIAIIILQQKLQSDFSVKEERREFITGRPFSAGIQEKAEDYPTNMFVLREGWGAEQPLLDLHDNILPLKRVIFIHTASHGTCSKNNACKQEVENIQYYHRNIKKYGDIGYNFVIGSDEFIYVGLGWNKIGAHSYGYNTGSLGVAFIGDFMRDEPNESMLKSAQELLKFGVERKKLSEDYQLFGHCQIMSVFPLSPGKNILKEIKTWTQWNSHNITQCVE